VINGRPFLSSAFFPALNKIFLEHKSPQNIFLKMKKSLDKKEKGVILIPSLVY